MIRLNIDGSKDTTFNVGTGVEITSPSFSNWGRVFIQPDGKILLGGSFTSYNGTTQTNIQAGSALIRINSDGSKDTSFNIGTGFFGASTANYECLFQKVTFQPDGKILVGGKFTSYQGVTSNRLIRLNSDGSIDNTFNIGIGFNAGVSNIAVQTDGKILVSGDFTTFNGLTQNRLVRLNSDGSNDTTFNVGTGFDRLVNSNNLQTDGKIIVAGGFNTFNGISQNKLVRLNTNGAKDATFNVGTGFPNSTSFNLLFINLQQDNKIIAFGDFEKYNDVGQNGFVRINTDGSKDESFLLGSLGFNGGDGNETGTGIGPGVQTLFLQSDDKLLVGGTFVSFNGLTENKLIRFNSDGKKDNTFNIKNSSITNLTFTGFNTGDVYAIAVQTDGKILVGGSFTTFNNVAQNRIIRLNTDGTKDATFNVGTGFDSNVNQILLQPDGKILLTGPFNTYNGVAKKKLIRLNQDGSIDSSLITFNSPDYAKIALQPDGKIIIGSFNGALSRLNTDGTNDVFFNVGTGLNNRIYKIIIQPDNKILVGGSFTTYNGLTQKSLIRFNNDGSKDTSFNIGGTGIGGSGGLIDMALQSDNKILICGGISSYNGITQQGIVRLMSDGTLDTSFIFGDTSNSYAFPNYSPSTLALKNNGIILVGGKFRNYFNYASSGLVGIRGNAVLSNDNFEITNNGITLFPNPVDNVLNFKTSNFSNVSKVSIYDLIGNQILKDKNVINDNIDISNLSKGIYLIKMTTTNDEIITKKIIKN